MITAIDVGASKTLIAQFKDSLEPINELCFPTPRDPQEFLRILLESTARSETPDSVSIGIPGNVNAAGTVDCPNLSWHQLPLKQMVAEHFSCPIYIENDANLAGLSEINSLPKIPALGLYLTVSTGIGSGLILQGRIPPVNTHEMGHMIFNFEGKWQEWEAFASGHAIVEKTGKMGEDFTDPAEWQLVADRLAVGLYAILPALQPNVLIIGGGMGAHLPHFLPQLQAKLAEHFPPLISVPPIQLAQHPQEAVLYGCYYHAVHQQA